MGLNFDLEIASSWIVCVCGDDCPALGSACVGGTEVTGGVAVGVPAPGFTQQPFSCSPDFSSG